MEVVQSVKDFQIIAKEDLEIMLNKHWLPLLNINGSDCLYIQKVEGHIEIGRTDIKLIH